MGTRLEGRAKRRAPHSTEGRAAHRRHPGSTCRGQPGRRPAFQDRPDHRGRRPDTRGGASRDPNKPHVAGAGPPRGRHGERVRGSDLAPAYPCGGRKARKVAVLGFPRNFLFRLPRPFPLPIPPVLALGLPPPPPATVVAADAGVLLTAEPAGAREVRKTAAGPLGLPLRARPSVPPPFPLWSPSGVVPAAPRFASLARGYSPRGFGCPGREGSASSLSLSAAAPGPAEVVRASETRARLPRGLRAGSSGGVRGSARSPERPG